MDPSASNEEFGKLRRESSASVDSLPVTETSHNSVHSLNSFGSSFRGMSNMKEVEENLRDLKNENFNLKLRIYFMEQQGLTNLRGDASEDVWKVNIDLQVQLEELKKQLNEKQDFLKKASLAISSLEDQLGKERELRKKETQLNNENISILTKELEEVKQKNKQETISEKSHALYLDAFGSVLESETGKSIEESDLHKVQNHKDENPVCNYSVISELDAPGDVEKQIQLRVICELESKVKSLNEVVAEQNEKLLRQSVELEERRNSPKDEMLSDDKVSDCGDDDDLKTTNCSVANMQETINTLTQLNVKVLEMSEEMISKEDIVAKCSETIEALKQQIKCNLQKKVSVARETDKDSRIDASREELELINQKLSKKSEELNELTVSRNDFIQQLEINAKNLAKAHKCIRGFVIEVQKKDRVINSLKNQLSENEACVSKDFEEKILKLQEDNFKLIETVDNAERENAKLLIEHQKVTSNLMLQLKQSTEDYDIQKTKVMELENEIVIKCNNIAIEKNAMIAELKDIKEKCADDIRKLEDQLRDKENVVKVLEKENKVKNFVQLIDGCTSPIARSDQGECLGPNLKVQIFELQEKLNCANQKVTELQQSISDHMSLPSEEKRLYEDFLSNVKLAVKDERQRLVKHGIEKAAKKYESVINSFHSDLIEVKKQTAESNNVQSMLQRRLEELTRFLEQILEMDNQGLLDLSQMSVDFRQSLCKSLDDTRNMSLTLSYSFLDQSSIQESMNQTQLEEDEYVIPHVDISVSSVDSNITNEDYKNMCASLQENIRKRLLKEEEIEIISQELHSAKEKISDLIENKATDSKDFSTQTEEQAQGPQSSHAQFELLPPSDMGYKHHTHFGSLGNLSKFEHKEDEEWSEPDKAVARNRIGLTALKPLTVLNNSSSDDERSEVNKMSHGNIKRGKSEKQGKRYNSIFDSVESMKDAIVKKDQKIKILISNGSKKDDKINELEQKLWTLSSKDINNEEIDNQINELERQVSGLHETIVKLERDIKSRDEKILFLQKQDRELNKKYNSLLNENNIVINDLQGQLGKNEIELANYYKFEESLKSEISNLKSTLEVSKKKISELSKIEDKLIAMEKKCGRQLQEIKEKVIKNERLLKEKAEIDNVHRNTTRKLKDIEVENKLLKQELELLQEKVTSLNLSSDPHKEAEKIDTLQELEIVHNRNNFDENSRDLDREENTKNSNRESSSSESARGNRPDMAYSGDSYKALKEENEKLSLKLLKTRAALKDALSKLTLSNKQKEKVDKAIFKELTKTHSVLKKARGNLENIQNVQS